ncbi:MAG: photosystem I reaction center subunit II [Cyanobacteria bacterium J06642_2]
MSADATLEAKPSGPTQDAKMPLFGGSTGGLLRAAEREEKYLITWTGKAGKVFEMPTSGSATMVEGKNMFYFPRKETCLALGTSLRSNFKVKDYKIYRVLPGEEPILIHPKDGVYSEKANEGREQIGKVDRNIGRSPEPPSYKFTNRRAYDS